MAAKEEIKLCWVTDLTVNHCACKLFHKDAIKMTDGNRIPK
jgi:hypothetical protein